jgi:flagellar protein FlaG
MSIALSTMTAASQYEAAPVMLKTAKKSSVQNNTEQQSTEAELKAGRQAKLSKENAQMLAAEMSKIDSYFNRKLQYSVNDDTDDIVVKVIDKTTDKVIRQIPPEALQKLEASMKQTEGILFNQDA